jgi:hypothetical protein
MDLKETRWKSGDEIHPVRGPERGRSVVVVWGTSYKPKGSGSSSGSVIAFPSDKYF